MENQCYVNLEGKWFFFFKQMNFVFINNEILFSNMLLILLEEPIKCLLTVTRLEQQSPDFLLYSTPKKNYFLILSFTIKCNTLDFWSQIHWVVPERKKETGKPPTPPTLLSSPMRSLPVWVQVQRDVEQFGTLGEQRCPLVDVLLNNTGRRRRWVVKVSRAASNQSHWVTESVQPPVTLYSKSHVCWQHKVSSQQKRKVFLLQQKALNPDWWFFFFFILSSSSSFSPWWRRWAAAWWPSCWSRRHDTCSPRPSRSCRTREPAEGAEGGGTIGCLVVRLHPGDHMQPVFSLFTLARPH